jgi:23S rRNA pseudouridine1911/1915/1917 synthase
MQKGIGKYHPRIPMPNDTRNITATQPDRLDRALAAAIPDISRARFQKLIAAGHVTVEGAAATDPGQRLKGAETITVTLPAAAPAEPQGENILLTIVYEDRDVIVIDKPAGLVVHPGAGHETGTLVNALIAHCGDSLSGIGGVRRPGIVHRIDKDTSGLIVIAKNDAAHASLSEQFAAHGRDGRLKREYLAFVWGTPERPSGTITTGIARSTANRQKMAVSRSASAREAITHYARQVVFGKPVIASLIKCNLETGRTHQIRVHLAHIGHPLLGDQIYGTGFASSLSKLEPVSRTYLKALKRQALHATVLGFEHPRSGKPLRFESPLPEDLSQLRHLLGQQSATGFRP